MTWLILNPELAELAAAAVIRSIMRSIVIGERCGVSLDTEIQFEQALWQTRIPEAVENMINYEIDVLAIMLHEALEDADESVGPLFGVAETRWLKGIHSDVDKVMIQYVRECRLPDRDWTKPIYLTFFSPAMREHRLEQLAADDIPNIVFTKILTRLAVLP